MTAFPIEPIRRPGQVSLGSWVTQLVERFPDFDEYDLSQMIEEKTGLPVDQEDFEAVRAHYLRTKLQAWVPHGDED